MLAGTPYRIVRRLGAGQSGEVFEVEHIELGKLFALKTLPRSGARFDRMERLRNECRALARLANANIVAVTDAGTTAHGVPYFVMPRYRGETLAARLGRGALRMTAALGIAADIASALGAAHGIGVLHRDVRPDNVLLEPGGAKLADFGVARFLGSDGLTARHLGPGTPCYVSPEQAAGGTVGARSDLFSLGLVLYEMVAGAAPEQDVDLAARVPGLDAEVGALVAKLLALDPVRRPRDASAVASQLRRIATRLAGSVGADAVTCEAHYDAVTDPGSAATMATVVSDRDATATRPDGVAAQRAEPRAEPTTRFDLPTPGAGQALAGYAPGSDAEPTTERIQRVAPPRPVATRGAPAAHKRFLAICAAIGAALGVLVVAAGACVASLAPEPVAASAAATRRHIALPGAPASATRPLVTPIARPHNAAPAPAHPVASAPAPTAAPTATRAPRHRTANRPAEHAPAGTPGACVEPPHAASQISLLPASGL